MNTFIWGDPHLLASHRVGLQVQGDRLVPMPLSEATQLLLALGSKASIVDLKTKAVLFRHEEAEALMEAVRQTISTPPFEDLLGEICL